MKNLKMLMALLAALTLVFAVGCSDGSDDLGYKDGGSSNGEQGGTEGSNGQDDDDKDTTKHYETLADGTWLVYTANGLQEWADTVNGGNTSLNCTLGADIDIQGASWMPVNSYTGTFDGNGHKVSNFDINQTSIYVGFFCALSGTVKGLGLEGATVTATNAQHVGGIAGNNEFGSIIACYFTGDVKATGESSRAGGIAGYNDMRSTIAACYYTNADDGVGDGSSSGTEATEVEGATTWATAQEKMNEAIPSGTGWVYDGAADDTPPTLKKSGS